MNLSGCSGLSHKIDAIHTLIGLGHNEKLKARAIKQETENFHNLKRYIIEEKIQKGITKEAASKKFGQPVVILSENRGQEWIYKPGQASWLGGEKIYLYFNESGTLEEWECVDLDCTPLAK
jgi:hypothetical protein